MKILGLNRVELLLDDRDMDAAVKKFNETLGFALETPQYLPEAAIRSAIDFKHGIELVSPAHDKSAIAHLLPKDKKGALLTIVWEVDDIAAAKAWVEEKGLPILYAYEGEHNGARIKQLCLDPSAFFGYVVTLM